MARAVTMTSLALAERPKLAIPQPSFQLIPPALDKTRTRKARQGIRLMELARKPLDPWQRQSFAIMVGETADGLYACPDYFEWCARQNGKGALLEARALAGLLIYDEPLIGWSAHEYRTAMVGRERCKTLIRNLGAVDLKDPNFVYVQLPGRELIRIKFNNSHGDEAIERVDESGVVIGTIRFFARTNGAGRGFSAPVWLLDETFALTDDHLDAISPTQLTFGDTSQTIYTSTPPLDGESGDPMYNLRDRAEARDPELGGRDWGLRKPDGTTMDLEDTDNPEALAAAGWPRELLGPRGLLDVDLVDLWALTNPAYGKERGGRITERAMRKDRKARGRLGFARETLGLWPLRTVSKLVALDPELWGSRSDPDSHLAETSALVLGVDVSRGADWAAISSAGIRPDGKLHTKVVRHKPGTSWLVAELRELIDTHKPVAVYVNSGGGPAGAITEDMTAAGITFVDIKGPEWMRACAAFVADLKSDRLRHCDQEALTDAIGAAVRKYVADGAFYWSRKESNGDISPLCASTSALHGFRVHAGQPDRQPLAQFG